MYNMLVNALMVFRGEFQISSRAGQVCSPGNFEKLTL